MLLKELNINSQLYLKAATPLHTQALFELIEAERENLQKFLDWPNKIQSLTDCESVIREMSLFNIGGQKYFCFIFQKGKLAGSLALSRIDYTNKKAELGFWKSRQRLSKQDMQIATEEFIKIAFQKLDLHRMEMHTLSANFAAKDLAQRLKFQQEAVLKEAIYRNDQFWDLEIWAKTLGQLPW